ncbi:stage II sporulation protein D [Priestia filamentosa]|uniref:stage II sporulation protein D n=1 Tax=Priestia filamentosa TaxID=1402861 RepID=UPI0002FE6F09|nr:stage II sporulation protein D [Priestia filamentosa]
MKRYKPLFITAAVLFTVVLIIPALLVVPFGEKANEESMESVQPPKKETESASAKKKQNATAVEVAVYRTETKEIEKLPLEKYVVGVVAAEMPAEFEEEALKAQALAARTYIVKHLTSGSSNLPGKANVTDTVQDQVYHNRKELKKLWKGSYEEKIQKIEEAVEETTGEILTYNGDPIEATFFSTSNGYTDNSEEYWTNSIPYLKSVESPWDKKSPKFTAKKVISVEQFEKSLDVTLGDGEQIGQIISTTPGKRVEKVKFDNKTLSGKDVRTKLELASTDFSFERHGNEITINTKGNGHGIGMSQYGANGMAEEGKDYQDIVHHYYQDVSISSYDQELNSLMAKK